ncbi:MAG: hypothetical protein IKT21_05870 [Methanomicrobium sp.]|nr:hypothetical protein [Methanomicrobium sp.]
MNIIEFIPHFLRHPFLQLIFLAICILGLLLGLTAAGTQKCRKYTFKVPGNDTRKDTRKDAGNDIRKDAGEMPVIMPVNISVTDFEKYNDMIE